MKNCGADAVVAVVVVAAAVVDDAELLLSWLWGAPEIKRMLNFVVTCSTNCLAPYVVYFDQRLGAVHSKCWSKS